MLTARLNLASVHLFFLFLLTSTVESHVKTVKTKDAMRKVDSLIATVSSTNGSLDCRLYTPTIGDCQECLIPIIDCFAAELKVLIQELDIAPQKIQLEKLTQYFEKTESQCKPCELFEEQDAIQFLKHLKKALEQINDCLATS